MIMINILLLKNLINLHQKILLKYYDKQIANFVNSTDLNKNELRIQ